jgi:anti-sigma B factor antagonist
MEIRSRCTREVTILDLAGRLRVSPGDTELLTLRSTIAELVAEGRVWVALRLTGLASIDARGLGELVFTLTTLRARGGDLMLIAPTAAVRKMLAVTRLDTVFSLYDSELEATRRLRRVGPSAGGGLLGNDFRSPLQSAAGQAG